MVRIEKLDPAGDLSLSLYVPVESATDHLAFKVLRSGGPLLLSDVLPLLENMGVRVTDERPYELQPRDGEPIWIYDFGLQHDEGADFQADPVRETFQDAFARMWRGEAENDGFNRLILSARLTSREITILRALAKYLRQAGGTFSQTYMEDALAAHPEIARGLVELFHLRLDPEQFLETDVQARALERELQIAIDAVASLDEDRILRSFLKAVRAVLRTNYFQTDADGQAKTHLSLKLDSALIPDLPEPRPMFEVFVYSPRTEAIHLRGGKVARGGIRWSDRREDFRTEVLGPDEGADGEERRDRPGRREGRLRRQAAARGRRPQGAAQDEVVECYRTFMRGLLDVTDTISGGQVVPPPDVARHDDDDPYLVVAADKGTGTFSDIANAISAEYGFWLGDAFASGGSVGYDHKAMGITARGAWESVKRHFRELDVDIETHRLHGRRDRRHVGRRLRQRDAALEPHQAARARSTTGTSSSTPTRPIPAASLAERERLFRLPGSSWADYDPALISPGGGVFPRTAKAIDLSPEARAALGVEETSLPPNELIRAVLRAPVDLLWNGGIGTYVKAEDERHAEVGDKTNDAVRVDARELRCRVVGEGGNLGFTQRARVEFALGGGRIFMDAIDNSAGRRLLRPRGQHQDPARRDRRGRRHHREAAERAARGDGGGGRRARPARQLRAGAGAQLVGRAGRLDGRGPRALHPEPRADGRAEPRARVPAERRGARRAPRGRRRAHGPRVRDPPLAHEDRALGRAARLGPGRRSGAREGARAATSPRRSASASTPQLQRHPLRREIIVTRIVNDLVNRAGTTFAFRLRDETGAGAADLARAYTAAREIFELRDLWAEIEALDGTIASETQVAMLLKARILLERATRWLLRHRRRPLDIPATIARFEPGAAALADAVPDLLGPAERQAARAYGASLVAAGVPTSLAERVAHLEALVPSLDIVEIAEAEGLDLVSVADVYFSLGATTRAAVAARADRRSLTRHALGGDGARRAARRRLLRAGGADGRGAERRRPRGHGPAAGRDVAGRERRARSSGRCSCSRTSGRAGRSTWRGSTSPFARSAT